MKSSKYHILVFVLSFTCGQYKLFAQSASIEECEACINLTYQVDTLMEVSKIQTSKSKEVIFRFLLCFDTKYSNAAELVQYSDEVLFKLLKDYPNLILEIMSKNKTQIPWKNICDQIAHPINDGINLNDILKKIEPISGYDNVKKDVIDALKKAII